MAVTETSTAGVIKTGGTVMGFALIATKVDLTLTFIILVLFSIVHGIIAYQSMKGDKSEDFNFTIIDFFLFFIVSIATGVMFTALGIIAGRGEVFIYMCTMTGSLLGLRGLDYAIRIVTKRLGGKEVGLFDNKTKGE